MILSPSTARALIPVELTVNKAFGYVLLEIVEFTPATESGEMPELKLQTTREDKRPQTCPSCKKQPSNDMHLHRAFLPRSRPHLAFVTDRYAGHHDLADMLHAEYVLIHL